MVMDGKRVRTSLRSKDDLPCVRLLVGDVGDAGLLVATSEFKGRVWVFMSMLAYGTVETLSERVRIGIKVPSWWLGRYSTMY